jgi:hypothetical protein
MNEPCLIFLHLPKTAGSTLTTVLRWQYRRLRPEQIMRFDTQGRGFDDIGLLPIDHRAQLKVLMGHFPYGVHDHLPNACRYVTIVREPVQRVVSTYRYVLSAPSHPLHETLASSAMSLDEYVSSGIHRFQAENALTRQLAGRDEEGDLTVHDLEVAERNLRSFLVVGLTEAFDESLILFKRILGWGMPFYFSRNVSGKGPRPERGSDTALDLIRERNGLDLEIYRLAGSLFESLVHQHGRRFDSEVKLFKLLNRGPRALGGVLEPIAPKVRRHLEQRALRRSSSV